MVDLVALEASSQPTGSDETAGSAGARELRPDLIPGVGA